MAANYTRPGGVGGTGAGDFEARMKELSQLVGKGKITTRVRYNQIYARRQHQNPQYNHPRGGQAFYLRDALHSTHRQHLQQVAQELFRGNVQQRYIAYGEQVDAKAAELAPVELGNLRKSGSVTVRVGGGIIYRRPAKQPRMTRAQLNRRERRR